MRDERREFNSSLRKVAVPVLKELGFAFDRSRTFSRLGPDGAVWEVQFQLGVRSMQGQFTVNLRLHQPNERELSARIGGVHKTRWTRLLAKVFKDEGSLWRTLLGPRDKWWCISAAPDEMQGALAEATAWLRADAIDWFQANTNASKDET